MNKSNSEPLVSIIIPFYNAEATIVKCLDSVLEQLYFNIEIICVDDGSTDSTVPIIQRYNDKRIVIYQKENGGNYSARNFGLDKARGKFITMVDADDYISCDYLVKNMNLFLEDDELDIVQIPFIMVDDQGKVVNNKQNYCGYIYSETEYLRAYFENVVTAFCTSKIVRKTVYDKFRFPLLKCSGDSYVQPYFAQYSRKTFLSDAGCYYYYQNPTSITKTKYNKEKTESSLKMHCHTYEALYNNLSLRDLRANRFMLSISMVGYAMREFGYEFSKSYIEFFAQRIPSFSDVFSSKISLKKKMKIILLKLIGIKNYCKIFRLK